MVQSFGLIAWVKEKKTYLDVAERDHLPRHYHHSGAEEGDGDYNVTRDGEDGDGRGHDDDCVGDQLKSFVLLLQDQSLLVPIQIEASLCQLARVR